MQSRRDLTEGEFDMNRPMQRGNRGRVQGSAFLPSMVLLCLVGLPVSALAGDRVLPVSEIASKICAPIQNNFAPPPPIGQVVVGTFDAGTGVFTWHPDAFLVPEPDFTNAKRLGFIKLNFDQFNIRPLDVNLNPGIISLPPGSVAVPNVSPGAGGIMPRSVPEIESRALPPAPGKRILQGLAPEGYAVFLPAKGAQLDLVFRVVNLPPSLALAQGGVSLTIGDRTALLQQGDTVDMVVPSTTTRVVFKIATKGRTLFTSLVGFLRPPYLGCFTLDAFPMTYLYQPPGNGSSQSYTTTQQVGTVIRTFSETSSSATRPVNTPFSMVGDFAAILKGVGGAVASAYPQAGGAMQATGGAIEALWGNSTTNTSESHTVLADKTLLIQDMQAQTLTTCGFGPGRGDRIHFLKNPVFAWIAVQDSFWGSIYFTISLLGYDRDSFPCAEDLRNGVFPYDSYSPQTRMMLLAHDPMTPEYRQSHPVSSANPNPAPERWLAAGLPIEFGSGGEIILTVSHVVQETETRMESTVINQTTTEIGGFLSLFATNVPQTGSNSLTTVHGSSAGTMIGSTTSVNVTLAGGGTGAVVQPYYDALYGTYAYEPISAGPVMMSGTVVDPAGRPLAGKEVLLLTPSGGSRTRTNAQGVYVFRSRSLQRGNLALEIEGRQFPITFEGKSVVNRPLVFGPGSPGAVRPRSVEPDPGTPEEGARKEQEPKESPKDTGY